MKAAVFRRYGPPDVVQIEDVEKPAPKDNEVLIAVRAASVNPLDVSWMRGTPYLTRMMGGLRKPKDTRLGVDVAGQVEVVGKSVTQFKPGDDVFGLGRGATGGVGTFAVQIAKSFGSDVTGVCSTRNVNLVRSLGADRVIDYTQEDFTKTGQRYDLVLDCVGNHSLFACRRVLNHKGKCIVVGGPHGGWLRPVDRLIKALVLSWFISQIVPFIAKGSNEDLTILHKLIEAGKITPVIDKCYRLSEVPEAIRYLEEGHARGKVVITIPG